MSQDITVVFPGKKQVDARCKGFTITTDQPKSSGGDGAAPTPFDYFLASLATCAGIYVLNFCQVRTIPTEGMTLTLSSRWDPELHLITDIDIAISLPDRFPDRYRKAVIKAAGQCTVKRHFEHPPRFNIACG